MALCSYSSRLAMDGYTVIDNTFLNEFLPQATGDDVKVYLYGLNLCSNPNNDDNDLDTLCKVYDSAIRKCYNHLTISLFDRDK